MIKSKVVLRPDALVGLESARALWRVVTKQDAPLDWTADELRAGLWLLQSGFFGYVDGMLEPIRIVPLRDASQIMEAAVVCLRKIRPSNKGV